VNVAGWTVTEPTRVDDNGRVTDLRMLGWDDAWSAAFEPYRSENLAPARVSVQHRGEYDVLTEDGERRTRITSRLRRESDRTELPVVGDWVALDAAGAIAAVLPRRTTISRRAAHEPASGVSREQVVAANVDVVFVVQSLGQELDRRLLERYLALAVESGARPVVVLTKADLEPDHDAVVAQVADVGGHPPILPVSARTRSGLDAVQAVLAEGTTGALLGPSGVGKSTLVNELVGDTVQATSEVREGDQRGRHTTTARELVPLPSGGVLIDTPGLRAVSLWDADEGLSKAFADIEALAAQCRFADCAHRTEPDCAVRAAVERGELDPDRLEHYLRLDQELDATARRRHARVMSRAQRQFYKRR
jgi:ribosome biogenesis GTPase / thiamine phosphate phosphatase